MAHRKVQTLKSDEVKLVDNRRSREIAKPDHIADMGEWYIVMQYLEHDGVAYFPLSHHLVKEGKVPERVPSNGSKDKYIPSDASGKINLAGLSDVEVWRLYRCGAVVPVDAAKSHNRIMNGRARGDVSAPQIVPPMARVTSLAGQYQQATGVPLSPEGMANLARAQATMPNPFGR